MVHDFEDFQIIAVQLEAHAGDAARRAAGVAEEDFAVFVFFAEADGEALVRNEDEFVVAGGEHAADHGVTFGEVDTDEAGLARGVGVVGERGLLNGAGLGRHDEVAVGDEVGHGEHGGDLFAFVEGEEGFDGFALGGAVALGDVVNFLRHALAVAGDEEDVVVGGGGEEVLHKILFVGFGTDDALAAAFLGAVVGDGGAFDEAEVGDGDDAAFVGDDVFHAEFAGGGDDLGFALVAVFVLHGEELGLDDFHQAGVGLEDLAEVGDQVLKFEVFGFDLAALQAGELVEAEFEDGVGLALGERILGHELRLGLVAVGGGADDFDEVVEVIEGDDVAFEDVRAVEGFLEAELGAAGDDVAAVFDEALDEFLDVHLLRALLVDGKERDAEGGFEGGFLEELVDDDAGLFAAFELDDDAGVFVGLVAEVTDAFEGFLADEFGDAEDEVGAVNVIRDLGDDDLLRAGLGLFGVGFAADADDAFAGLEVGEDAFAAGDDAAGGEVGALDEGAEFVDGDAGVVDDRAGGGDDLVQVVRRDVGRHADRDAGRAVHQEIRQGGREDGGLGGGLFVVGREVDGVFLDVGEEVFGDVLEAGLGVAVGGGGVAVDGAEVALRVDERVAHDPILREADEGVVNGGVAVGVVVFEDFTDDAGALVEGAVVQEAFAEHRVEDAALHGLQAVARVGEGARDDDRHRVFDVGRLHDVGDVGRREFFVTCIHGLKGIKCVKRVAWC